MATDKPSGERKSTLLLEEEMKDAYLTYAMSVIVSRALPDVRDGLKPSQRRILVAMNDLNLGPRSKHRKCAKIAGDTSGNYHPHGESVIYPTLVRMAQDFNMRYPLVDGQGNFGSIDGDPPAAMRYTEARMTAATLELQEDLERDTVDFVPNYDDTRKEPTVLPGKFPNLLCNGSSGIAVGMATSIPPHNLREICDGISTLLDRPDIDNEELFTLVKGPDFPTGGIICGTSGIRTAYRTGRGQITVRARIDIEHHPKSGQAYIVVTELPYLVQKTRLIERVAELVKEEVIPGISDIRDESDRKGMRLLFIVRRGEEEQVVLNQLFKHTPLQSTFSLIMIALVDQRPRTLALKELMEHYRDHRKEVIRRRSRFLLARARERAHIVEGLRIAQEHIDEVIAIIRAAADRAAAAAELMARLALSSKQAEAILDMRLHRLTGLERQKLEEEYAALQAEIADLEDILARESRVIDIIRADVHELRARYGDDRRTQIGEPLEDLSQEDLIPDEQMVVTLSHTGYVKRNATDAYRRQARGGKGITGAGTKDGDFVEHMFVAGTHDYILVFTDYGKVYWLKVHQLPEQGRTAKGRALVNMLPLESDEKVQSLLQVSSFDDRYLVLATRGGVIKKTVLSAFARPKRTGIRAILLDEGDQLIGVRLVAGDDHVMLATRMGQAIRFAHEAVRPVGRSTRGVRGISLRQGDAVVDVVRIAPGTTILTVCENGYGKRSPVDDYRVTNRGGKGIINIKVTDKNGSVVAVRAVTDEQELFLITADGMVVRTPIGGISTIGRATQGVRILRLGEKDRFASVAVVDRDAD